MEAAKAQNWAVEPPEEYTILPVVLYGCETWSLTLREERRLGCLRTGC
jgi:hypothetical protein